MNISRSYVSKLLIEARGAGVVEIKIRNMLEAESKIETALREKFGLKKAIVVPLEAGEFDPKLDKVTRAVARYLHGILSDGDIVGVSWGITMHSLARNLISKELSGVLVTQLYGGYSHDERGVHVSEIVANFARAYNATPYYLMLPAIVDSEEMKKSIIKDKSVSNVLNLALKSQIALFSVGRFGIGSSLVRRGYFSDQEVRKLLAKGVVGDACARLYDINGEIVVDDFDRRVIGIPLDNLRRKRYSVLVVADEKKTRSAYGALKGGYANVLAADEGTARRLLSLKP